MTRVFNYQLAQDFQSKLNAKGFETRIQKYRPGQESNLRPPLSTRNIRLEGSIPGQIDIFPF